MRSARAFTLIELLVVLSIIAILVAIAAVTYGNIQRKARDQRRAGDLRAIKSALDQYAADNDQGLYPSTCSGVTSPPTCSEATVQWWSEDCSPSGMWQTKGTDLWIPNLVMDGYIKQLPKDPRHKKPNSRLSFCVGSTTFSTGEGSCYVYKSNGLDYKLMAHCTSEHTIQSDDPFFDGTRNWAMTLYTPGAKTW